MRLEEHVSGKNIFWSTFIGKSRERKKNDFPNCPFDYQPIRTADSANGA